MHKYLGMHSSVRLSFSRKLNDVSQKAKKGVICTDLQSAMVARREISSNVLQIV